MLLEVDIEKRIAGFHLYAEFLLNGRRCGVFGPSGSGKSTLMNLLAGLMEPDRGRLRLNGKTLFDSSSRINLPPQQRRIGVVFQHSHLFPHLNVRRNLHYGMKRRPPGAGAIDPDQLIDILQLGGLLSRRVAGLSGGERQRVALGRAILASPDLILMDEPLTGLDGTLKYQIIPHLQRVFSEFSIPMLFISHDLQEMRLMTEDVLVMKDGMIERQIPIEVLARSGSMSGRRYMNLLRLESPEDLGDLLRCRWGELELMLVKTHDGGSGQFCLNASDILLFKQHPQATSARNMLSCTVRGTYQTDWLVGVELDCRGHTLVAEIVPQSIEELGIREGSEVVAVIKASAFKRMY